MRRRTTLCLTLLAALGSTASAKADVSKDLAAIDARFNKCIDKDGSNAGMVECTDTAGQDADKILNRVYGAMTSKLKAPADSDEAERNRETLKRLVAAERAWIAYRDAECRFRGTEMLGGSGEGLAIVGCTYAMTSQRAKALDDTQKDR